MKKINYPKPKKAVNHSKDGLMRGSAKPLLPGFKHTSQGLAPLQGDTHLGLIFLLFHGI